MRQGGAIGIAGGAAGLSSLAFAKQNAHTMIETLETFYNLGVF